EAAAAAFLDQRGEVDVRLEAEQREFEAVLPGGLAVAAAGVAAELGEDGHDLVAEVDGQIDVAAGGLDGELDGLVAVPGDDGGGAVGQRDDAAGGGDADDLLVGDLVGDVVGEVNGLPADGGGEDELLGVVETLEGDGVRFDRERLDLGGFGKSSGWKFGWFF